MRTLRTTLEGHWMPSSGDMDESRFSIFTIGFKMIRPSVKIVFLRNENFKRVFLHNWHNNNHLRYNFYERYSPFLLYQFISWRLVQPFTRYAIYFIIHFRTNGFIEFQIDAKYRHFTLGAIYPSSFQARRMTSWKVGPEVSAISSCSPTYIIIPIISGGSFLIRLPR